MRAFLDCEGNTGTARMCVSQLRPYLTTVAAGVTLTPTRGRNRYVQEISRFVLSESAICRRQTPFVPLVLPRRGSRYRKGGVWCWARFVRDIACPLVLIKCGIRMRWVDSAINSLAISASLRFGIREF